MSLIWSLKEVHLYLWSEKLRKQALQAQKGQAVLESLCTLVPLRTMGCPINIGENKLLTMHFLAQFTLGLALQTFFKLLREDYSKPSAWCWVEKEAVRIVKEFISLQMTERDWHLEWTCTQARKLVGGSYDLVIHSLARSRLGNLIHQPISLMYCTSVNQSSCHPMAKKSSPSPFSRPSLNLIKEQKFCLKQKHW